LLYPPGLLRCTERHSFLLGSNRSEPLMMVALLDSLTRLVIGQVRSVDAMGTRSKESVNSTQSVCDVCCVVLGDHHRPRVLPLTVDDISAKARASAVSGSFFSSTARVGGSSCWDRGSWAAGMSEGLSVSTGERPRRCRCRFRSRCGSSRPWRAPLGSSLALPRSNTDSAPSSLQQAVQFHL
jgi:hypothetical protein